MDHTPVGTIGLADDMVRASIRALMAGERHNNVSLAKVIGMSDETLRRKLAASGRQSAFTAGELTVIADYFGRTLDDLVTGLGGMVRPPDPSRAPVDTLTAAPRKRASARSSTDRASDYGSEVRSRLSGSRVLTAPKLRLQGQIRPAA